MQSLAAHHLLYVNADQLSPALKENKENIPLMFVFNS